MKLIIISALIIGLAVLLLLITGEKIMRSSHIDDSKALKKRGIECANKQMSELSSRQNLTERVADNPQ